MTTHIPMAVHPSVKNVLVIGAGDGGIIRELTKYPEIEHIDMVEIDRAGSGSVQEISAADRLPAG